MMNHPAIEIENITVKFKRRTLLDRFSLSVTSGERVTLTGRSGSGKSTILQCLLGFVLPAEGSILIEKEKITSASIWKIRRKLAYVAQEPDLGTGTVREVLDRPLKFKANSHLNCDISTSHELFDRLLLPRSLLQSQIRELSGGEKQRVAIISSIMLQRKIFLLDEVTSALDKESKQALVEFFISLPDITVLSVSHEPESFGLGSRVVKLQDGRGIERS